MTAEKHPAFWKIKALVHARGEAQARAQLTALMAQYSDAALGAALKAEGFDPKANYRLDDEAETITLETAPPKEQS